MEVTRDSVSRVHLGPDYTIIFITIISSDEVPSLCVRQAVTPHIMEGLPRMQLRART